MENEFVSYKQAVALKELGFNKPCLAYWNYHTQELNYNSHPSTFHSEDVIQLPLKQQVLRWFREKYDGEHWIGKRFIGKLYVIRYVFLKDEAITFGEESIFNTYEEAENACIDKLIELAKQEEK
jgi:hypothetical protein